MSVLSKLGHHHPVALRRRQRAWAQTELAQRSGLPRSTVSAIEARRLTPSVAAALALARALECSVEELFSDTSPAPAGAAPAWAWAPQTDGCRYWEAEVDGRRRLYPVESLSMNVHPHDGVWCGGLARDTGPSQAERTLLLACCDPAAGLLAHEFARTSGFRLIVLSRGGGRSVDLLQRRLVHVAGLHCSTTEQPERNAAAVRAHLGGGFQLLRVAHWQEGLAFAAGVRERSPRGIARNVRRWALREAGSAARECLDDLVPAAPGRTVFSHTAVAEAVRGGWADAGVCVQLAAEEAGLNFVPVRTEAFDFCFPDALRHDPRIQALVRLLRSRSYRRLLGDLPGYDARPAGETAAA